jgi:hypothetical protein
LRTKKTNEIRKISEIIGFLNLLFLDFESVDRRLVRLRHIRIYAEPAERVLPGIPRMKKDMV